MPKTKQELIDYVANFLPEKDKKHVLQVVSVYADMLVLEGWGGEMAEEILSSWKGSDAQKTI